MSFVIKSSKGYLNKSARGWTRDINQAKIYNAKRSAESAWSFAISDARPTTIVPVEVSVKEVTNAK